MTTDETRAVLSAIKTRRSFRKYKSTPVPQALINQVIEAGTYAASGKSQQPWRVIVVNQRGSESPSTPHQRPNHGSKCRCRPLLRSPRLPHSHSRPHQPQRCLRWYAHDGQHDACRTRLRLRLVLDKPCTRGVRHAPMASLAQRTGH